MLQRCVRFMAAIHSGGRVIGENQPAMNVAVLSKQVEVQARHSSVI
jgi:hypothetical protein